MFHYPVGKAYGAPRPSPHRRANYPSPRIARRATRLLTTVRKYQISGRHCLCWRNIVSPCCRKWRRTKERVSRLQAKYAPKTQIYQSIDIIYRSI